MWGKFGSWWDDNVVHGGLNTAEVYTDAKSVIGESGKIGFMGFDLEWGTSKEEDILKYGFMALGVFVIIKLAGK